MTLRGFLSTSTLTPTIRQLLAKSTPGTSAPVKVCGWVKSIRHQKRVAFAVISDGSSTSNLQAVFSDVVAARRCTRLFQLYARTDNSDRLNNGSSVCLTGVLADSPGHGQDKELQVEKVDWVGECDPEVSFMEKCFEMQESHGFPQVYPIQKQALSVDYLRDHCHLRARTDQAAAVVRYRDHAMKALHNYFEVRLSSYNPFKV